MKYPLMTCNLIPRLICTTAFLELSYTKVCMTYTVGDLPSFSSSCNLHQFLARGGINF